MRLKQTYAGIALVIFLVEVFIASFFESGFVRNQLGDLLVVGLLYFLAGAVFPYNRVKTALGVLIFSFFVELIQASPFLEIMGWQDQTWAKLVFGNSFQYHDLLMYTLGVILSYLADFYVLNKGTH